MSGNVPQVAALLQFVTGLSLALVLAFLAILVRHRLTRGWRGKFAVYDGVAFGVIGMAIMLFPFPIVPGAALDVRIVPVVLAGLFSGPAAALIAGGIVAGYRLYLGGPGVIAGTGAIVTAALFGAALAHRWRGRLHRVGVGKLVLVGLVLAAITLGWTLILPSDIVDAALATFTVPVLISHPLGVVILGSLAFYEQNRRRMETALRESEARLRAFIDNSTAAVFLKDVDGRYVLANRLCATRFNRTTGQIIGKTAGDLFAPDLAARFLDEDREVLDSGEPITKEISVPYADGSTHVEMMVKFPVVDAEGRITAIGGIAADITPLKRAEEAVRRSEAQFRVFFEKAHLLFLSLDADANVTGCNDFLLRLTGYEREELIGLNWIDTVVPKDIRPTIRRVFEESLQSDGAVPSPHYENDILTRRGETRRIAWDSAISQGMDETEPTLVAVGADVTERHRALNTIQVEKERAERYLAIAGTIILALDRQNRITLINRKGCDVLGYSEDELLGKDWFETAIPEDIRDDVRTALIPDNWGPQGTFENEIVTKTGERRLIAWSNSVVLDGDGTITGSLSSGIDITDQRRAEEELQALRDRLAHVARVGTMGEMATGFAHELNQPLAAVTNYAHGALRRIEMGRGSLEEIVPALQQLTTQAERAGEIIRRIRAFVRKDALTKRPIDLNRAIHDALAFVRSDCERAGITLNLSLDDSLPEVDADSVQIQQVVINLLRNAVDALLGVEERQRWIEIRTARCAQDFIEVSVIDNGPGLTPEVAADLFEPFVTTKADGMGIGLSICRSTVQAHGGDLRAEPRPGGGMVFRFTLPLTLEN